MESRLIHWRFNIFFLMLCTSWTLLWKNCDTNQSKNWLISTFFVHNDMSFIKTFLVIEMAHYSTIPVEWGAYYSVVRTNRGGWALTEGIWYVKNKIWIVKWPSWLALDFLFRSSFWQKLLKKPSDSIFMKKWFLCLLGIHICFSFFTSATPNSLSKSKEKRKMRKRKTASLQ